eukprot:TRINITY_DN10354_c0_g1_i1.p1 TRINITY_DN10354_c0_g1~~TRINITY_DN10354_c0_g1_i1.p1  ORF type:complete len:161 (-),score=42.38 TRINITY_DN10354_c0_g1_i1:233-715(-)
MFACCLTSGGDVVVEKDAVQPAALSTSDAAAKREEEAKLQATLANAAAPPAPAAPAMIEVKLEPGRVGMRVGERTNRVMEVVQDGAMHKFNESAPAERKIAKGDVLVGVNVDGKWLVASNEPADPLPEGDRAKELKELVIKLQEAAQARQQVTLMFKKKA